MNTHGHDHDPDEREWQAQERALRELRTGRAAPLEAEDSALVQYRAIARALSEPPSVTLPPGFAADIARRVQARDHAAVHDNGLDRWLVRALVAVFALSALLALGAYGVRLLAMLQVGFGTQGLQWLALLAGCVALSWSLDWLRRRSDDDGPLRAA